MLPKKGQLYVRNHAVLLALLISACGDGSPRNPGGEPAASTDGQDPGSEDPGQTDGGAPSDGAPSTDSDGDGLSDSEELALGTNPEQADSDGDGFSDGEEVFLGSNPNGEGGSCASSSAQAEQDTRPVDIVLVVDNSSSMSDSITSIVERINGDFAQILANADIDYRLILISRHGAIGHDSGNSCDDHGICIQPPLAAGNCDATGAPKQTDTFKHYSVCIDSNDALRKVRRAFDGTEASAHFAPSGALAELPASAEGWSQWLRPGAFRTFLLVTDDNSNSSASDFEDWMYTQDAGFFGTRDNPNWAFHAIVDVEANSPDPDAAWPASEPVIERGCYDGSNQWIGEDYQVLARQSGGLRFPYCRHANYDAVFRAVATSVTNSARLSCIFSPTLETADGEADFSRALVVYENATGTRTLDQVASAQACGNDAFYVVEDQIHLCPDICSEVESDLSGSLRTLVACFDEQTCGNGMRDAGEMCDDGNRADGDGCDSQCRIEVI